MEMLLFFISGVGLGALLTYAVLLQVAKGNLIVDFTDPNKDVFRFELDNFDDLYDHDIIVCRVIRHMEKDVE